MIPRFGARPRLCGILLLALAVSPVTAPFSTFDPGLLFHDPAPQGGAILQAKPASSDEPVAAAGGIFDFRVRLETAPSRPAGSTGSPRTRVLDNPPLRI